MFFVYILIATLINNKTPEPTRRRQNFLYGRRRTGPNIFIVGGSLGTKLIDPLKLSEKCACTIAQQNRQKQATTLHLPHLSLGFDPSSSFCVIAPSGLVCLFGKRLLSLFYCFVIFGFGSRLEVL
jgi:hypothetical protein